MVLIAESFLSPDRKHKRHLPRSNVWIKLPVLQAFHEVVRGMLTPIMVERIWSIYYEENPVGRTVSFRLSNSNRTFTMSRCISIVKKGYVCYIVYYWGGMQSFILFRNLKPTECVFFACNVYHWSRCFFPFPCAGAKEKKEKKVKKDNNTYQRSSTFWVLQVSNVSCFHGFTVSPFFEEQLEQAPYTSTGLWSCHHINGLITFGIYTII